MPPIGRFIRNLRKKRGLRINPLAKKLRINSTLLRHIEAGTVLPTENLIKRITTTFKVAIEGPTVLSNRLPKDIETIITRYPEPTYAVLRKNFEQLRGKSRARVRKETASFASDNSDVVYSKRKYRLIDLFCGAGGFTLGFHQAGKFQSVLSNDFNSYAAKTYNANFGDHCIHGDINDLLSDKSFHLPEADVVIGGPPCQGFSLLNKQRDFDPRKELWRAYMDVVRRVKPAVFVMENVPELLSSIEFQKIKQQAESLGYMMVADILNAADYGVPQRRKRAIVIACRYGKPDLPSPTHCDPQKKGNLFRMGLLPWETVGRAIEDLPEPFGTDIRVGVIASPMDLHFGRTPTKESLARYRCIPEGGNRFDLQKRRPDLTPACWIRKKSGGTDLFGRLWHDRPAFTIRTEFFKPEKGRYLHPRQNRPLTHREAARLQAFPDNFMFMGTKLEVAKQIGNAVPPPLAKRIAETVLECLSSQP